MAFGIDDALSAAAAGINLTDTCVKTIEAYRKKSERLDIELLIEEVRVTALRSIDDADVALVQMERTLVDKGVDTRRTLREVISHTSFWKPFEAYRMKKIRRSFNELADATYSAIDDIASLVRCSERTGPMGHAVVESAGAKEKLNARLRDSKSVQESIAILRKELRRHKDALTH